ncbi:hydrogenase iron-sulfur subunit [Thermanaeromonas sp. C210]|uniref:hydrogenase iron-sulfur subunit n=1 Tax=Thermanaeromonas sp. C210 TaxID=2731925 RepID=UPI00155C01EB|nr:hydrogenase iron-sulfur subunit [Thermanaeromonas sp. C210]GFN23609.1 methyl-viologen-reducing hydrogenase subunit delta [Thermanaeromonas sp. C210]
MAEFEPKIVAFCCYYCAYSAADLAGSLRLQYPANVRLIEFPCTGKVDVRVLLGAFEEGADGVYVAGCLEGDCHFLKGNIRARKRVEYTKKLLDEIGIGGERLEMYNLSSSMGPRFAEIAREFTERIKSLGPSPLNRGYFPTKEEKAGEQT